MAARYPPNPPSSGQNYRRRGNHVENNSSGSTSSNLNNNNSNTNANYRNNYHNSSYRNSNNLNNSSTNRSQRPPSSQRPSNSRSRTPSSGRHSPRSNASGSSGILKYPNQSSSGSLKKTNGGVMEEHAGINRSHHRRHMLQNSTCHSYRQPSSIEYVENVLGLNIKYLKNRRDPKLCSKLGVPGIYPIDMNYPEEQFTLYLKQKEGYVTPLPSIFLRHAPSNRNGNTSNAIQNSSSAIVAQYNNPTPFICRPEQYGSLFHSYPCSLRIDPRKYLIHQYDIFKKEVLNGECDEVIKMETNSSLIYQECNNVISSRSNFSRISSSNISSVRLSNNNSVSSSLLDFYEKQSNYNCNDEKKAKEWMQKLASGMKTFPELLCTTIPTANASTSNFPFCPWTTKNGSVLIDLVAEYQPPLQEATWYIQLNLINLERKELLKLASQNSTYFGYEGGKDWLISTNMKRLKDRSFTWTEQLMQYIHLTSRQLSVSASTSDSVATSTSTTNYIYNNVKSIDKNQPSSSAAPISTGRNKARNINVFNIKKANTTAVNPQDQPQNAFQRLREKWLYILRLIDYQVGIGLLDVPKYLDGLLYIYECMFNSQHGQNSSIISQPYSRGRESQSEKINPPLRTEDCRIILSIVLKELPRLFQSIDLARMLVKTTLSNLQRCQNSLKSSFVEILRMVLLSAPDTVVAIEQDFKHWPVEVWHKEYTLYSPHWKDLDSYLEACTKAKKNIGQRIDRLHQVD